jgi:hypothetical protein
MSLHSHPGQSSSPSPNMDRVISLSRQKLRLESTRGEPDLRKLLAHVCTVEHVQGWLLANPPSREAPSPPRDSELDARLNELPRLSKVQSVPSMSNKWPTSEIRSIVTAVREVESDDDTDGEEGEEMSGSEKSWNGSDDATFGEYMRIDAFYSTTPIFGDNGCRFGYPLTAVVDASLLLREVKSALC